MQATIFVFFQLFGISKKLSRRVFSTLIESEERDEGRADGRGELSGGNVELNCSNLFLHVMLAAVAPP